MCDFENIKVISGTWYQISDIPQFFTKNLVGTTVTYDFKEGSNDIKIINKAKKYTLDGSDAGITAKLWVPNNGEKLGKCQAQFVWPLWSDYCKKL
jgi:lipocalin